MNALLVGIGGGLGAMARYGVGQAVAAPWGTLTVNVLGSLLMGVLIGVLAAHHEAQKLLLGVGFLGGFTTFSAFSLDAVQLAQSGRVGLAAAYIALSVGVAIAALLLGLFLARAFA